MVLVTVTYHIGRMLRHISGDSDIVPCSTHPHMCHHFDRLLLHTRSSLPTLGTGPSPWLWLWDVLAVKGLPHCYRNSSYSQWNRVLQLAFGWWWWWCCVFHQCWVCVRQGPGSCNHSNMPSNNWLSDKSKWPINKVRAFGPSKILVLTKMNDFSRTF